MPIGIEERSPLPIASWQVNPPSLYAPTTDSGINNIIWMWGLTEFSVTQFNTHELDHDTETQWAQKDIVGGPIYREWTGENDEQLFIRGRVFPYRLNGFMTMELMETYRRSHIVNLMIRGDGRMMGWYALIKLVRGHTFLSAEGIGQQIAFEGVFARMPVPAADDRISQMWETVINPQGIA
jgi:phage protein U